jgi:hypothetical protein
MQALTIDTRSLESPCGFAEALSQFHPEIAGSDETGYCVSVELDREVIALLDALQAYVSAWANGPAESSLPGAVTPCTLPRRSTAALLMNNERRLWRHL